MPNRSPDEIRNDIEDTREELGDTVEALAAKTDVKAQAHAKIEDVKQQAQSKVDEAKSKVAEAKHRVESKIGGGGDAGGTAPVSGATTTAFPADAAQKAREGARLAQQKAAEKPMHSAAIAGFLIGLIAGRLMCRRKH
ncbi:MAG: DUF3618 domain-containing protein [Solirubrobacterales bacterium]|nr:DUF3618 domain-containing protein [Solirubrobacterales bacterium]